MVKKKGRAYYNDLIFYCLMAILPLLQFAVFYVGVNLNSLLLAFKKYEVVGNAYKYVFGAGFSNFRDVVTELSTKSYMLTAVKNSAVIYLVHLVIVTPLALIFSFYIIKKLPLSKFFRVVLFVPTIVCSIILTFMYNVIADNIVPEIMTKIFHTEFGKYQLLANIDTRFGAIVFFSVFLSFGINVLMYSGAMSGVSGDIIEASKIDGCSDYKEFIHIVLPLVYPTLTTFLIVGIAGFFTNQAYIFDFRGQNADSSIWTLGYYMFKSTATGEEKFEMYPYLSAMGLLFTLIAAPVTLAAKWALEKFGPSVE